MRGDLLRLCADAEARLEARCSDALTALDDPLRHVRLFPFYDSYACLCDLEHRLLSAHAPDRLAGAAFLGSGSLPLSSLLLAARHMPDAVVDSFDRSPQMLKKPSHPSAAMIAQLLKKKLLG